MLCVAKEDRLNLRIKPDFKFDLETLAEYYGLSPSSYAHSLLVRALRVEKANHPEAFSVSEKRGPLKGSLVPSMPEEQRKKKVS